MNIKQYDADTHVLRRKGRKRPYTNAEGKTYFHPHIRMMASEYARTRKVYALFRKQIKAKLGVELADDSTVYRHYLLMLLEHAAREMKIGDSGVKVITKMMLPLPKDEWIKKGKKK